MATVDCLGWQATARRGLQCFCSNICVALSLVLTCTMELTVDTTKFLQEKVSRDHTSKHTIKQLTLELIKDWMVLPFSPHCPHGSFSRLSFCLYLHFLLPDDVRFCLQTVVVERPLCKLFGKGDGNDSVQVEFNVSDEKFEPFIIKYDMAFSVTSYNISVTKRNHTGILTAYTFYIYIKLWLSLAFFFTRLLWWDKW